MHTPTTKTLSTLLTALLLTLTACSKDDGEDNNEPAPEDMASGEQDMTTDEEDMPAEDMATPEDMPPEVDMAPAEDMAPVEDMPPEEDMAAPEDMAVEVDMGAPLPDTCEGDCAVQTLEADFNGTTRPFERAVYGLSAPSQTGSGEWEIYIEALHGGFMGCPNEASPTPERTLILSGLVIPTGDRELSEADGLRATLLDFEGALEPDEPFVRATAVTITPAALDVCTECVGQAPPSDEDGFVAFDLSATFPDGTISGRVYAVHCDSMDTSE